MVGQTGPVITCRTNGKTSDLVNLASSNYLGMAENREIKGQAQQTIQKYAVGSCGPRGFYGTIDTHLELEKALANAYGTEDCNIYTDSVGCIGAVIPAFAKKTDLLVIDDGCHYLI